MLSLPISLKEGSQHSLLTSFFTATSATCVTGLIKADTYMNWSTFGQVVIITLIQIGGIGFMTICITAISLTRKKIGLASRSLMQNSISAPQLGGIVRMTKFVLIGTLVIESIGALLLAFYFCPLLGVGRGIWFSVFHSISAFCNAGFDLLGIYGQPFSSITSLCGNWYVNIIIMSLIILGGLGFFVWYNILESKFRIKKMSLHTRIVLFMTAVLVFGGALLLFLLEHGGPAYEGKPVSDQIAASLFQSVSARTAGFNSVDLGALTDSGKFIIVGLMLIGGSPGSTAGGIKTTTFAILVLSIVTTFRHRKSTEVFGRRMEEGITRTASCVFMLYLFLSCGTAAIISHIEMIPFIDALLETASAIATVGMTVGITPALGTVSTLILSFLMIFGRVGSITTLLAFSSNRNVKVSSLPLEKVQIG